MGDEGEQIIIPRTEKVVDFYGDDVPAAQDATGKIYVPLRQLSDNLGITFSGQRQRVNRDPVMANTARQVEMRVADGRRLVLMCLPIDIIPGWLFGITTSKTKPELQEKLTRYRAECFDVLWNAFKGDISPAAAPAADISGARLALEIATAVQHLAQQQLETEEGLTRVAGKQEAMADYMRGFIRQTNSRLSSLELRLDPAAQISDEQAAEVALAVKNVAYAMEQRGMAGGYGKIYSEMYRRYRISSYKNLPRSNYDEVLGWLSKWYDEITKNKGE